MVCPPLSFINVFLHVWKEKVQRMFRDDLFYQVVGHTPVEEPLEACGVLTLDLFSTYPDGTAYGNQKLYIVDTITRKYKEAKCKKV